MSRRLPASRRTLAVGLFFQLEHQERGRRNMQNRRNQMPGQDMRDIEQYVADRVSRTSACATRVTFLCNSGAGADLGEEYEVNIILALISSNQKPSGVRPPHWQGHQKIGASRLDILDSSSNSSRYRGKTKHARLEQRDAKRYLSTY